MKKQASGQLCIVAGQARVESRVTLWARCPLCQHEHHHILTAQDYPDLPGKRYWWFECHGSICHLAISSTTIADALALAADIAGEYALSQQWLTQSTDQSGWTYPS